MKKLLVPFFALLLFSCVNSSRQNATDSQNASPRVEETTAETAKPMPPVYVVCDVYGEKFLLRQRFDEDEKPSAPDSLNKYKFVIYKRKPHAVSFLRFQPENAEMNTGRDTYRNFDNLSGWLYTMDSGKLLENPKDEWYAIWDAALLVDDLFLKQNDILPFKDKSAPTADIKVALEKKYGRKIKSVVSSQAFGEKGEYLFVNVQFVNKGAEALGVTALCKNGSLLATKDFPAAWNDESVWRVDDEGEFHGLQLDLATLCNGVLTLYTANFGAEGTNYASFVIKDGSFADGGLSDTFYQSPE